MFHHTPPEYLVYTELHKSTTGKNWLKGITKINPSWIWSLGKNLCSLTRPTELNIKEGKVIGMDRIKGDERIVGVVPHLRSLGVDLPAIKMKQRRQGSKWVYVVE